jgi:hypothetical protein
VEGKGDLQGGKGQLDISIELLLSRARVCACMAPAITILKGSSTMFGAEAWTFIGEVGRVLQGGRLPSSNFRSTWGFGWGRYTCGCRCLRGRLRANCEQVQQTGVSHTTGQRRNSLFTLCVLTQQLSPHRTAPHRIPPHRAVPHRIASVFMFDCINCAIDSMRSIVPVSSYMLI